MSDALLRHRGPVLLALLAFTVALAAGIPRSGTDVGYRAFLGEDHPAVSRLDAFLARFGGGLTLRAVWRCGESPCESALDETSLAMTQAVSAALEGSAGVRRVVHPGNAPLLVSDLDGVGVRTLLEDGHPVPDLERLARRARNDPTWVGELVSDDGLTGALVVVLDSSASEVARSVYARLDAALGPFVSEGFHFHRVGGPVEFVVAGQELDTAMARIVPAMVALVALGLAVLLRSFVATGAALATVGVAVLWTLGAQGWLGWARNSLTQTLPPLVLVIGVCDGIHLISRYAARCAARPPPDAAARRFEMARAMDEVARPCLLTTVTTAAGFASFATADLESFVRFGWTAAFGVSTALLASFTLLPIVLCALPAERVGRPPAVAAWSRALARLTRFSQRRATAIVAAAALLGVIGAVGFARLRVDSSFEDLYGRDSDVVAWSHFVGEHLAPPDRLEIDLALPPDLGLGSAEVQRLTEDLGLRIATATHLEPRSFLDRPHWRAELLAATAGREGGIAHWIDLAGRHVRLSFPAGKLPQDEMRASMDRVRAILPTLPPGYHAVATGPFAVVNDMVEAIRTTQLRSFAGAALVVGALLVVGLGSLRWAALAMLPTTLPVLVTLGAMGWLSVPLDIGSAMVAAVVLGIAVDDTIHVLERFRSRRAAGHSGPEAIGTAIREVGQALVSTSLALALGFCALALSPWRSVASFGLVSGAAILAALVAVLLLLPALVCSVSRRADGASRGCDAADPGLRAA